MLTPKPKCGNCGTELIKALTREGFAIFVRPKVKPSKATTEHGFQAFLFCEKPKEQTTQPKEAVAIVH